MKLELKNISVILIDLDKNITAGTADEIITEENMKRTYGIETGITDCLLESGRAVRYCVPTGSERGCSFRAKGMVRIISCLLMALILFTGMNETMAADESDTGEAVSTEATVKPEENREPACEKTKEIVLDDVQIRDIRSPKEKYNISTPVTKVGSEYLNENMFTTMVDLLDSIPGFSTRFEVHSPIYMRGFSGNNILILQDGCRRISSTPEGTRANIINAFNVEAVEITKGPGSVLFGSGALTGIINVKTRDIFREKGMDVEVKSSYATNNNERNNACMLNCNTGVFAFDIGARMRGADNYTFPDGTEAEHSNLKDRDVFSKIGFKPSENQKIIFSSDIHLGGPWSKAAGFNGKPNLEVYFDREDAYHFSLMYEITGFLFLDTLQLLTYYDYENIVNGKRWFTDAGNMTTDDVACRKDSYGGLDLFMEKSIGNNKLAAGFDSYFYRVWIDTSSFSVLSADDGYVDSESIQGGGTNAAGVFMEDRISFRKMDVVAGLRYDVAEVMEGDHHNASLDSVDGYASSKMKGALSGNLGMLYRFCRGTSWNVNLGRAFRMPTYNEMYSETVTGKGVVSGNPATEPEYSLNFDAGIKFKRRGLKLEADLFLNFYEDLITTELVDPENVEAGYVYGNVNCARIYGGELFLSYNFMDLLMPDSMLAPSASWTCYIGDEISKNEYIDLAGGTPLSGVPNSELTPALRFIKQFMNMQIFADISGTYAFSQNRVPDGYDTYDSYYHLEFKAGMTMNDIWFFDSLKVFLTIKNLTNNEYYLFEGALPSKGRDFRVSLSAKL